MRTAAISVGLFHEDRKMASFLDTTSKHADLKPAADTRGGDAQMAHTETDQPIAPESEEALKYWDRPSISSTKLTQILQQVGPVGLGRENEC